METVSITVELPKEAYELGQGVVGIMLAVKDALADGWQPGIDVPVIIVKSLDSLVPALQGVDKLGDEAKENPARFGKALGMSVADGAEAILKKD